MRRLGLFAAVVVAVLAFACSSTPEGADGADGALSFGVTTPTGDANAQQHVDGIARALADAIGRPVTGRVFGSYEALSDAIAAGEVDLAWMPPLTYVRAARKAEVVPLRKATRNGNPAYKAVIFTRADKSYGSPGDLSGAKMAWVSPSSSSGYLFPKALLIEAGVQPDTFLGAQEFLGDHEAVCKAVLEGRADAGATFTDDVSVGSPAEVTACRTVLPADGAKLKVLTATDPVPADVIVARAGLSDGARRSVSDALDKLALQGDFKKTIGDLFHADGLVPADKKDFAPVERALGLLEPAGK